MVKYELKTKATNDSVADFLATLDDSQRRDSETLIAIMQRVSGESAVMWGKIIGFGSLKYSTKNGAEMDWMRIGFAPRKGKLSLYVTYDAAVFEADLRKVGEHKTGKGCIYFKNLDTVDVIELEKLIRKAYNQAGASA